MNRPGCETLRRAGLLLGLGLVAGCATGGPNHIYFTASGSPAVHDVGATPALVDHAVAPGEQVLGLAYDFNTDHLFLRIAPAQVIRVIERPSGKILREMPLPAGLKTDAPADLAIRSSDRHLFAAHPDGRSVVELTLWGEVVRRIELPETAGPIGGLAYDQKNGRLLVLTPTSPAQVGYVTPGGSVTYYVTLAGPLRAVSLGYDSDAQHYFVPLADGHGVGEFDATGKPVATHLSDGQSVTAIDAGPRSFVRVF